MSSRCRQALNVRAIALGLAKDPEPIVFVVDEVSFIREQLASTIDAMGALLKSMEPSITRLTAARPLGSM